jgi:hypothetical protein
MNERVFSSRPGFAQAPRTGSASWVSLLEGDISKERTAFLTEEAKT